MRAHVHRILLGGLLLGHLPLLIQHVINLWQRPHYQFCVLVPLGALLLARRDTQGGLAVSPAPTWQWVPILSGGLVLLAAASWIYSPWLAMLAFLVSTAGAAMLAGGIPLFRQLLRAWVFLFMMIPLPGAMDVVLVGALRSVVTHWSSAVLDHFGWLHLTSGSVLELPDKTLFVADACSGIHSLFVLLACGLFIGLWRRRHVIHIALLCAAAFGIVMCENVARIVSIAIGASFDVDLADGWPHTVLGMVLFAVSTLFLLSADHLLRFMLPGRSPSEAAAGPPAETSVPQPWFAGLSRPWAGAFAIGFLLAGAYQVLLMPAQAADYRQAIRTDSARVPELGADHLPTEWQGWEQVDFRVEQRIKEDPMGEFSQQWVFRKGDVLATVSFDYPFQRLHDLSRCYAAVGWDVGSTRIADYPSPAEPYGIAELRRSWYGRALLLFSLYNERGDCRVEFRRQMNLSDIVLRRVDPLPWYQIQAFATCSKPFTEGDREAVKALFLEMRDRLKQAG